MEGFAWIRIRILIILDLCIICMQYFLIDSVLCSKPTTSTAYLIPKAILEYKANPQSFVHHRPRAREQKHESDTIELGSPWPWPTTTAQLNLFTTICCYYSGINWALSRHFLFCCCCSGLKLGCNRVCSGCEGHASGILIRIHGTWSIVLLPHNYYRSYHHHHPRSLRVYL